MTKNNLVCRPSQNAVKCAPKCTIKAKIPKISHPTSDTRTSAPLVNPHKKNYIPSNNPAIRQRKFKDATAQIYNHVGLIKRIKNSKKPLNCDLII